VKTIGGPQLNILLSILTENLRTKHGLLCLLFNAYRSPIIIFHEVKGLGVRELQKKSKAELPLIDKMALYEKYKVDPRHLVPLYTELYERDERLTLSEVKIPGLEATLLVSNAREKLRANPSGEGRSTLPEGMETGDVFRAVERELGVREGQ